ncbi:hypothetical protein [Dactylosporangium sp. CA-092794]|uniref:hypothetical protein n=1 Tax=Dactylosporangium sp. CA-092794 TaxID=3239929 RepID=UPI003D8F52F9
MTTGGRQCPFPGDAADAGQPGAGAQASMPDRIVRPIAGLPTCASEPSRRLAQGAKIGNYEAFQVIMPSRCRRNRSIRKRLRTDRDRTVAVDWEQPQRAPKATVGEGSAARLPEPFYFTPTSHTTCQV